MSAAGGEEVGSLMGWLHHLLGFETRSKDPT